MARQWTPDLTVGISEVDAQHKALFEKVNSLLDAMSKGDAAREIRGTFEFLGKYAVEHFSLEESLMLRHEYPSYTAHNLQHQSFISEFTKMKQEVEQKGFSAALILRLHSRLSEWLVNHISKTDVLFGKYLNQRRVG